MPEITQAAISSNQLNRIQSVEKTGSYGNQLLKTSAGSKPVPSTQNRQNDSVHISAQGREMFMKMAGANQSYIESETLKYARQRPKIKFENPPKMNWGQKSGKGGAEKQTIDPNILIAEKATQKTDEQKKADNKRIEKIFKRIKEESQSYKKYVEEGYKYEDTDPLRLTAENIQTTMKRYKPTETFITSMQNIIKSYLSFDKSE